MDLASLRAFYAESGSPAAIIEEVYARLDRNADSGARIFLGNTLELIRKDTTLLHSTKVIAVRQLPAGAIDTSLTDEILQEHGLKAPTVQLNAQPENAFK